MGVGEGGRKNAISATCGDAASGGNGVEMAGLGIEGAGRKNPHGRHAGCGKSRIARLREVDLRLVLQHPGA